MDPDHLTFILVPESGVELYSFMSSTGIGYILTFILVPESGVELYSFMSSTGIGYILIQNDNLKGTMNLPSIRKIKS